MSYPFIKDQHYRYYEDMQLNNIIDFIYNIKEISKETDTEFYEVIQAYDMHLKTVKAKAQDEQYDMIEQHLSNISMSIQDLPEIFNTPHWAKNLEMTIFAHEISDSISNLNHTLKGVYE